MAFVIAFFLSGRAMVTVRTPESRSLFTNSVMVAFPFTSDQFTTFIAGERSKWAEVVKASGATAN
jgi:tripartite-type tricarboxylate transporter receptor subunit TctC